MSEIPVAQLDIGAAISLGAEARISKGKLLDLDVICKERITKSYRDQAIDLKLRKERTIQEIRILLLAGRNDLPVPRIYDVDKQRWMIVMELIPGTPLREMMNEIDISAIFFKIGQFIAEFHQLDIIHGDYTTSNILIRDNRPYFIDFGLGFISTSIEDKAVDILVMKHILESSHTPYAEEAFNRLLDGYLHANDPGQVVINRLSVVEDRVRYRSEQENG